MFDRVVALHHAVDAYLLENILHVVLCELLSVKDLARINCLLLVDCGSHNFLSFLVFAWRRHKV